MTDPTTTLLEIYESVSKDENATPSVETPATRLAEYRESARQQYLKAASVLHQFSFEKLMPMENLSALELDGKQITFDPAALLLDDTTRVAGSGSEDLSTLKLEARRRALAELGSREQMLRALDSNPYRIVTELQQMWENFLQTGKYPEPERAGYAEIMRMYQIASWIEDIDKDFPTKTLLLDLAKKKSVLSSFEHLVTSTFTGREAEIRKIAEYLGLITESKASLPERVNRFIFGNSPTDVQFLSIVGVGGIGKSALIGKVLSDIEASELRIPFAYLAFDQPTLRVEDPFTILIEAAAQLELQYPNQSEIFEIFKEKVREFRDIRGYYQHRISSKPTRGERIGEIQTANAELAMSFGRLLSSIIQAEPNGPSVPVLLVLDTFEEVQYRDSESLYGFWRMLEIVREACPQFRVVICGRSSIADAYFEKGRLSELVLGGLEPANRVKLLQALGVANVTLAEAIGAQIGGNPLSLRLAANVVNSNLDSFTDQGIANLTTQKWFLFQIDEQIIQGQLYRRILDHIHDENVRKLAHPGMVLRRVDPDVILNLLAPFNKIPISTLEEAEELFENLRREHGLVRMGDDRSLEYRPEVRLSVLKLLQQDAEVDVRDLHERAVEYYQNRDSLPNRAEELYHRLVLDQDPGILAERWLPGIEQSVARSLDEYPDRTKAWLASWISLEVPRSVFEKADLAEWERNITRKVQRALSEAAIDRALSLLRERSDRTENSQLFAYEAKAYLLLEDYNAAREILLKGIEKVTSGNNRGRVAELFWLLSQVELLSNNIEKGDQYLKQAEQTVNKAKNPIPVMHVICHRILLRNTYRQITVNENPVIELRPTDINNDSEGNLKESDINGDSTNDLKVRLNIACRRLDAYQIGSAAFVVRFTISLLDSTYAVAKTKLQEMIRSSFETVEFSSDLLTSDNLKGLEQYQESWEQEREYWGDGSSPSEESAA